MNNLFVKTGDTVVLLTGDDKYRGKKGKVLALPICSCIRSTK